MIPFYTSNQGKALESRVEACESNKAELVVVDFQHTITQDEQTSIIEDVLYSYGIDITDLNIPRSAEHISILSTDYESSWTCFAYDFEGEYITIIYFLYGASLADQPLNNAKIVYIDSKAF